MSPLTRVAGLAAVAAGAVVAAAVPAAAAPSTPSTPSTQEASPTGGGTPSEEQSTQEGPSASQTPSEEQSAQEGASPSETPSAHGTPSAQDTQFLQQAHQTNIAEIAAGHLAQQKGKSQTVKNLGAKFVTDHTKLDQSLQSVANSLGVSLPTTPNSDQQAVQNQLKNRSGTQFDNLFVTSQFVGHTQAMQAAQTEIANGSDPKVVKLATDSLPVIESHHQALQAAAKQLGIPLPTVTPVPTATATPATATPEPTASPTNTNS